MEENECERGQGKGRAEAVCKYEELTFTSLTASRIPRQRASEISLPQVVASHGSSFCAVGSCPNVHIGEVRAGCHGDATARLPERDEKIKPPGLGVGQGCHAAEDLATSKYVQVIILECRWQEIIRYFPMFGPCAGDHRQFQLWITG